MTVKELIKKLKKYPSNTYVRVSIGYDFWKHDGFLDEDNKKIKISKKIKEGIDHNLFIPNYWIEEIEETSAGEQREITLHGYY